MAFRHYSTWKKHLANHSTKPTITSPSTTRDLSAGKSSTQRNITSSSRNLVTDAGNGSTMDIDDTDECSTTTSTNTSSTVTFTGRLVAAGTFNAVETSDTSRPLVDDPVTNEVRGE